MRPGQRASQFTAQVADAALWAIESGGMPQGRAAVSTGW